MLGQFGAAADQVELSIDALVSSYDHAPAAGAGSNAHASAGKQVDIALARERLKLAQLCFNDVQHTLSEAEQAVGRMDLVKALCCACARALTAVRRAQFDYRQLSAEDGAGGRNSVNRMAAWLSEVEQEAQQLEHMRIALTEIVASIGGHAQ